MAVWVMKKILILEDEKSIRDFVVFNFKKAGYEVFEAGTGAEALSVFYQNEGINLAILDVMLPDIDGFQVCRKLREKNRAMGIVMLSAKDLDEDVLSGFVSGADDYVKKPISPSVLVAKIDALYRRIGSQAQVPVQAPVQTTVQAAPVQDNIVIEMTKYENSPFAIDQKRHIAMKNGKPLDLTPVEFSILKFFLEHQNVPLSREEILQAVWGYDFNGDDDIVNVNIRRLRVKIEDVPKKPVFIQTEWGYGYRWVNSTEDE
jgi:DNA-binding response OmpR family regulator